MEYEPSILENVNFSMLLKLMLQKHPRIAQKHEIVLRNVIQKTTHYTKTLQQQLDNSLKMN